MHQALHVENFQYRPYPGLAADYVVVVFSNQNCRLVSNLLVKEEGGDCWLENLVGIDGMGKDPMAVAEQELSLCTLPVRAEEVWMRPFS